MKNCEPSRFIEEIDPEFIRVSRKFSRPSPEEENQPSGGYARSLVKGIRKTTQSRPVNKKSSYKPPVDFTPSDTTDLKEGMKVEHPKFGFGKVLEMDENGANRKAKVNFDDFGEKTLLLSFAKLKIHDN